MLKKYYYLLVGFILSWTPRAFAASAPPIQPAGSQSIAPKSLNDMVGHLGDGIIVLIGEVAFYLSVIFLIWYGIQYLSSGGSPDKAKVAKAGVINSIIGIAVIVTAYSIITLGYAIANSISFIAK